MSKGLDQKHMLERIRKAMQAAGDPHPSSAAYRDVMLVTAASMGYEAGYVQATREAIELASDNRITQIATIKAGLEAKLNG